MPWAQTLKIVIVRKATEAFDVSFQMQLPSFPLSASTIQYLQWVSEVLA